MATKNRHSKLMLATPVYERLQWEIEYLNLGSRVFEPSANVQIKSAAALVRWAVALFIDWYEAGGAEGFEPLSAAETEGFSFYLSKMGAWDYAVKHHYARSYSDLATQALYWYFDKIDNKLDSDRATFARLQQMSPDELMQMFRAGGLEDALSLA